MEEHHMVWSHRSPSPDHAKAHVEELEKITEASKRFKSCEKRFKVAVAVAQKIKIRKRKKKRWKSNRRETSWKSSGRRLNHARLWSLLSSARSLWPNTRRKEPQSPLQRYPESLWLLKNNSVNKDDKLSRHMKAPSETKSTAARS